MAFEEFTKPEWKISDPGSSGEGKDHIIKIGGTWENVTVTCQGNPKHLYDCGEYVEGDPGSIERKAIPAYKIILDREKKQITCNPSPVHLYGGTAGSWTANDNSGGSGGE